jgi:hypothetical protein
VVSVSVQLGPDAASALQLDADVDRCVAVRLDCNSPTEVILVTSTARTNYAVIAGTQLLSEGARFCFAKQSRATLESTASACRATLLVPKQQY